MESEERIIDLEKRVRQLEGDIALLKTKDKPLKSQSMPKLKNEVVTPGVKENKQPRDWEKEIGQVWLPRIFIFILLIGVIWAFRAGTELGLINEYVRVAFGYLASIVLLFFGWKQHLKKHIVLSQVLVGGSIGLMFISTFAMHVLYGFIPLIIAFLLHVLTVGAGLTFSVQLKSQSIGIISSIGASIVPFLLASQEGNLTFFLGYEFIVFLAFIALAFKREFDILYYVVTYGFQFALLAYAIFQVEPDVRLLTGAVVLQHLVLVGMLLIRKQAKESSLFPVLTTAVLTSIWVISSLNTVETNVVLLGLVGLYLILLYLKKEESHKTALFVSSSAIVLFVYFMEMFETSVALLLLVEGLIVILLTGRLKSKLQAVIGAVIYSIGMILTFSMTIFSFFSIETVTWAVLIASLTSLYLLFNDSDYVKRNAVIFAKVFISLLGLVYVSQLAGLTTSDSMMQPMVMSLSWLMYAVLFVAYGFYKNDKITRIFGMALIFFTLAKVILIDIPAVSMAIRAILFLLLGTLGITISRLFYRKAEKTGDSHAPK
ncbi:hypothetical protein CR203_03985 [Salipaludibacillus neizhouensis]|uniref:DUF2339 domain-containing protein n=1 Tax=Salipaludibacillus neizhouensis TaxID=885475 RepID=A0A3A9KF46_9BACI|nr:DUF2339 domain-containing protein [Salipaludibacillus neizhouensis]RKL69201.1 hypothetical protein CR203_03985 [Salipaludibacillus neizhouensis]